MIGDSIVAWNKGRIESELAWCCRATVVGRTGARSDEMVPAAELVGAADPEVAIINLGTNDALQTVDPAATRAAALDLIAAFRGTSCVYLVNVSTSMAAMPGGGLDTARIDATAAEINDIYAELAAADVHVDVIDWNAMLIDAAAEGISLSTDTVHPNGEGLDVLTAAYRDATRRCPG